MGEKEAKQSPIITKYLELSYTNKTMGWIVWALFDSEGMGFNECYNLAAKMRLEAEPQLKGLSKTTFSAAMKELQKIGAVLKDQSKTHSQKYRFTLAKPLLDDFKLLYEEYTKADMTNVNEVYGVFKSVGPRASVVFIGDIALGHILSAFKFSIGHPDFAGERLYLMLKYLQVFGQAFAKLSINGSDEYVAAFKELNEKWTKFRNMEYPDVNDELLKAGSKGL